MSNETFSGLDGTIVFRPAIEATGLSGRPEPSVGGSGKMLKENSLGTEEESALVPVYELVPVPAEGASDNDFTGALGVAISFASEMVAVDSSGENRRRAAMLWSSSLC